MRVGVVQIDVVPQGAVAVLGGDGGGRQRGEQPVGGEQRGREPREALAVAAGEQDG
ncbi:hypothetical protein [Kingella sp. (in: b-proteobacteria)]|uniref:hypothetical protein n=1 Tax=Kingella sp. (in: b-proteobacteria) TaxID=2020713 RepID=UPI0026DC4EDC|nr:hypothetical protein [Kingella sp. (in: b-proteobacteria)]MDO4657428.1 hypothetical protein [Kingella sp. (in: b-proteobacteria)]